MKTAVFAYTRSGILTARKVLALFENEDRRSFVPERFREEGFRPIPKSSRAFYGEQFSWADAMIFVGACGIAVRAVAPHIRDKRTDPAVICVDDMGKYVIPVLSGHIGGANDLAKKLAEALDAEAVITTATDIHCRFSVDSWAKQQGLTIGNMQRAKEISAAILEQDIPLYSEFPVGSAYPAGIYPAENGPIGIYIGWIKKDPFTKTLRLIPRNLHIGIGCRRGTAAETIRCAVNTVLDEYKIDPRAVRTISSIDLKADEAGLAEYAAAENIPLTFFSAGELRAVPGCWHHSDFVEQVTGVDNVCERAAMIRSDCLIVPRTIFNGVTVAVGAEIPEVKFE